MTLHWWMHWFWVTTLLITIASGWTIAAPQSEELQHITTDTETLHTTTENNTEEALKALPQNVTDNATDIAHPSIQWTPVNATEASVTNATIEPATLQPATMNANVTEAATEDVKNVTKKRNVTAPEYVKDESGLEGASESRIVTEKPLSLETAFLQTRIPPNIESYRRVVDNDGGMDTGAIAGISFAALVLTALAGSTAFVLYRRRYLNKPQTLNDKCSNPDSSGYLDDSTIRDNSEEMYSLDNDSFLNSLEAMTIQNYWTDTVKHTKL